MYQQYPPNYESYTAHTHPVNTHKNFAITALVLGVVGAIFGLIPLTFLIALSAGVLAIVFGFIGRKQGMGKAGVTLGTIALCLGIWGAVIVNKAANDLDNDLTCINNAQTAEQLNAC